MAAPHDASSVAVRGRIVIAGGSGFLGLSLARFIANPDCDIVILSRHAPTHGPWRHAAWDARTHGAWARELDGAAAVVNLAGRTVDCVKTPDHCDEILRSRVESTNAIGAALRTLDNPPAVWVQMSTAHIYGDPPDLICDETSATGHGLAPAVGLAWEAACRNSALPSMRQVILRTSFVLDRDEGALKRLALLARVGLGGTVGHGRQGISWIHVLDMNRLFARALADVNMTGTYVATAPNPVSNAVFMRALRNAIGAPIGLPATEWMVRLGAPLVMRTDPELALYGRYCVSKRLRDEGFAFTFPEVTEALSDLYRRSGR